MRKLIDSLLESGATICHTEDPRRYWAAMRALGKLVGSGTYTRGIKLQKGRDRYIAQQVVSQQLGVDDVGILFMGASHDVPSFLPPHIKVKIYHRADVLSSPVLDFIKDQGIARYFLGEDDFGHSPH